MDTQPSAKSILRQDPRQVDFVQNPYALYRQIHQIGVPVFWENYGFWCLADFASVNAVLRDRRFARLPPPGHEMSSPAEHLSDFTAAERHSLLVLEPPEHTRLRQRVNRAFVSRQVERMKSGIERLANRCIDRFQECGEIELLAHYATPIPVSVITELLGVPESAGEQLIAWSHAMVRVYTLTQSYEEEVLANRAAREFRAFLQQVVNDKRRQPADDLLSALINTDDDDEPLSDDEIISVAILLLNAGHEATVHQLGNAVHTLLSQYPPSQRGVLDAMLTDDDRCDALVNECLRYAAPLHLFLRYAQQQITLEHGLTLKPGEQIGLLLAAANRCPLHFTDPEEFRPQRKPAGHLSLGAGIHFCVGAQLARLELRVALQVLFKRLPGLALNGAVEYQDTYHFHGLQQLPVRW